MKSILMRWLGLVGVGSILALPACGGSERLVEHAPFPTEPPAALAERPVDFPDFRETTLANGLRLIVLEHRSQPLVSVNLYIGAGSSHDPAERAGLASMTADLLTKGTPARSATEISEEIERVGGSLGASAGVDWLTFSANVLAEHLPLALELVSQSAVEPTFPAEEVELTRRRMLSSLQSALGQPGQIAQRAFDRAVYGIEHPYGIAAVPASVQEIGRPEIEDFHQRRFVASNAMIVVAGDVDSGEAEQLVERYFGGWRSGDPAEVDFPTVSPGEATQIRFVHRPGSAQTNILVGHLGYRPATPDYFPILVMNGILGGHADARLFRILREERGWTYGSYSRFTRPREIGVFSASAEVRAEVADSTVQELLIQLRRIRDEPVPVDELEATKSFLAGSFPLRIETAGQIAASIATTRLLGLPVENLTEYRERILAVTAEEVQRVAREYVHPDNAVIVVVGDARELLARLEAIAPVTLYDVQGERLERSVIGD